MMQNLIASAKDTYIRDLLEGRMLQRVDDEKNRVRIKRGWRVFAWPLSG
jgi:hypothetical protein